MWVYHSVTRGKPGNQRGDVTTYEVGYYAPADGVKDLQFHTVETYDERENAREAVHYLNGGAGEPGMIVPITPEHSLP